MPVNRGSAATWALGLGVLSAAIAGSVVSAQTPDQEMRQVVGLALVFIPALYLVIVRQWPVWARKHPFVRFVVFLVGGFVAMVVLGLVMTALVGGYGVVSRVFEFLAVVAGFGVATWLTCYGGGERLWTALIARTDIDW